MPLPSGDTTSKRMVERLSFRTVERRARVIGDGDSVAQLFGDSSETVGCLTCIIHDQDFHVSLLRRSQYVRVQKSKANAILAASNRQASSGTWNGRCSNELARALARAGQNVI
jgi:hypothetical protein